MRQGCYLDIRMLIELPVYHSNKREGKNMDHPILIWSDLLATLKDVVLIFTAMIASYVGLKGLGAWRRQLKGNTEYVLAKDMLRSIYELREAVSIVRHPFMSHLEHANIPDERAKDLSYREKVVYGRAAAYQKRWDYILKAKSALDAKLLEAEVVWGRNIVDITKPLTTLIAELSWAIQDSFEDLDSKGYSNNQDIEELKKRRQIMFARGDDKDQFKKRLDEVISTIEKEMKPHIEKYHQ